VGTDIAYPNLQIEGLTLNCKRLLTPSVSDNLGTSITASWTPPTTEPLPTGYTWKVVPAGVSVDAPTVFTGTTPDSSVLITGLSSGTSYDFYVRTTCTDRNLLRWTSPIPFTMGCPSITNFPFIENFETTVGQSLPNCWTETQVSGTPKNWRTEPTSGQLNTRSVSIKTAYEDEEYLILSQITLNDIGRESDEYVAAGGKRQSEIDAQKQQTLEGKKKSADQAAQKAAEAAIQQATDEAVRKALEEAAKKAADDAAQK
jgi:hypothetical protein